jgi:uncharacterized membrane protein
MLGLSLRLRTRHVEGMTFRILPLITLGAALGCGLVAGIFFAFSTFVMPALARILPAEGIAAMNSINVTVINPWFMAVFLGTGALDVYLAVHALRNLSSPNALLLLAGSLLYLLGTLLVTMVFNVPRNDALAAVDAKSVEGVAYFVRYLSEWTFWNTVRTVAALAASLLLTVALMRGRA